jgi:crotonobetainyl-CoA:carnitine CoA-transferase CaiB-like acyl-CoA transferase
MSATPPSARLSPPQLGADTDAILLEFGYSPEELADLKADNVI